ncbi:MAG TPA: putative LPS assembly protein LptD [Chitinophagaceae bacterium]|nr:putative LPS assembly protein LptD [Chitinophagaceae bacterium]
MNQLRKFRANYFSAGVLTAVIALIFCTITPKIASAHAPSKYFYSTLTTRQDTIPTRKNDSLQNRVDSLRDSLVAKPLIDTTKPNQKIDTFAFKVSKDSLDAPVHYEAEDSAVVLIKQKKILLYGKTKTDYKDITLTAPKVEVDQETQIVTAYNSVDSLGEIIERANFKQGETAFQSDTIRFNFKTQKGLTKNTFTESGGAFIQAKYAKKINPSTMYAKNGVMTTCDYDDPHFGFHYDKIKIINNKLAITGPIHPEFEGVPVPIYLPFGIFPLNQGRHSGFIAPTFETNEQYGLGLVNGGYYKVLNQYFDIMLRGDIYSYGGWRATITPTYRRRYKFNGGLNFSVQTTKQNFKGDPDYTKVRTFNINWNHSVDTRARPGTSFSANVNAGSTKYNRYVSNVPQLNFQNQLTSSITYSKNWIGKPYVLTVSANHNQNNNLHYINLNLPDIGFTVQTLYPFQQAEVIGTPKWYEKLGIGYSGSFSNSISFYDTVKYGQNGVKPFLQYLLDTAQWSAHHSIPITLSLPPVLGGALLISPGISYGQDWIQRITKYSWDTAAKKVDTSFRKGVFIDQRASFSLGFNTALYGTYQFKNSKIIAIRHVVRPSLSLSYTPDLNKSHLQKVIIDTTNRELTYNDFGGSIVSYGGGRSFGGLSFQLDNNLEMKVKSKDSSADNGQKKIRLIDGYGFSTAYDLMADSFQLSNPNFYFRSTLFEKISITANATVNPYDYDTTGFPVNKLFSRNGKFYLGRITNGNLSISTDFKSKPKDPKKEESRKKQMNEILNDPNLIDQQNLLDYMRQNPNEFVDFNIQWSANLGLSLSFYEQAKPDYSGFEKKFSSNLNFGGSFLLSPKWNFNVNGYYDLDTKKLQTFQMNISRDMHCWQMSISVTPVGLYRFFSVNISPKSSILQDLKINRTRSFTN